MAHLKAHIGIHAAWILGLICAIFGGRPAMVNGATGAFGAIIGTFIPANGAGENGEDVELLFPSVMFAGFLMMLVVYFRMPRFITMLPTPVLLGFSNGLAIVIGRAQFHPFKDGDGGWRGGMEALFMCVHAGTSMLIMEFLPKVPHKFFKVVPGSLISLATCMFIEFVVVRNAGYRTRTIGEVNEFTMDTAFPIPFFLDHAITEEYDCSKIFRDAAAVQTWLTQGFLLALVGVFESLITTDIVESFVKTPSNPNRVVLAMGAGNIVCGFFGSMGGNALIGLSTFNCLIGGRGRLCNFVTAVCVMACIMGAYPILNLVPIAALSGLMWVVVLHIFKWNTLLMLVALFLPPHVREKYDMQRHVPFVEVMAILATTLLCIFTNIAYGALAGLAVCAVGYSWDSGQSFKVVTSFSKAGDVKYYDVDAPLFFGSSTRFLKMMDPEADPDKVEVRFGYSAVMDFSAVETLFKIATKYKAAGKAISFTSLNVSSMELVRNVYNLLGKLDCTEKEEGAVDMADGKLEGLPKAQDEQNVDDSDGLLEADRLRKREDPLKDLEAIQLSCDGRPAAAGAPQQAQQPKAGQSSGLCCPMPLKLGMW